MNLLAALGLTPKPQPLRYVVSTKRENETARRKRTEVHLVLAVENEVLPRPPLLLTPAQRRVG